MRTETRTIKIFKYEELEGHAKDKAREWLTDYESFDYIFNSALGSLNAFGKAFGVTWRQVDFIEPYRNNVRTAIEDNILELSGLRLRTYIINHFEGILWQPKYIGALKTNEYVNHRRIKSPREKNSVGSRFNPYYSGCQVISKNCNLSGVCYDESLLKPLYDFIEKDFANKSYDLSDLLKWGVDQLCKDVQSEIEANCKDEALIEHCEANNYEFDENGNLI